MIQIRKYVYRGKVLTDAVFIQELISRDIAPCLGITTYPRGSKFMPEGGCVVHFDRELTDAEKAALDSLIDRNPTPTAEYVLDTITADDVEREVGVRPIVFRVTPEGFVKAKFDKALTPDQESKLEACLSKPMRFRRI